MKDGFVIKFMWLVMGRAVKESLPILGVSDSKTIWKEAKKIYRREMNKLPEYGPNDVLKVNLTHAVMLSSVYEACNPKPDIDALTKFYREFFLRQRIVMVVLKRSDMLKPSVVKRQIANGEKSQKAAHPFTWQYKIQVEDENRFTAVFTRCGIYDYLKSRGMAHITPAMCAADYLFGECSNHLFLRESTIATGGEVCDCKYVSKRVATQEEIRRSKENKRSEALRGGRKEL
jgi:hypothetical protein